MSKLSFVLAGAAILLGAGDVQAADFGVKVGVLTCQVESGWGFVVGSSKDMDCVYRPITGAEDRYSGTIWKLGLDLGYTESGTIVWDVVAPTSDIGSGALSGSYGGATASATVVAGVGANILVGGFYKSLTLQPVSMMGDAGFDIAAGIGAMRLSEAVPPPPPPRVAMAPPPPSPHRAEVFKVFFAFNDDKLTPEGQAVIRDAAESVQRRNNTNLQVMVFGNTDTVGSYRYNGALSDRRAEAVKEELGRDGVDPAIIGAVGHSFDDPDIETDPGVREKLNRRATIIVRSVPENPAG